MNKTLVGKTALVTGASSGLGMDFARELARRGCGLVLVARREDRLKELQKEIADKVLVPVDVVVMDLVEADAPGRLYQKLQSAGTQVDVLVNNAGYGLFGEFCEVPWEQTENMLQLDVLALTRLMYTFLGGMVERGSGFILNVASTGAYQPTPTYAAYSAAKGYVLSLTEAVHYELRRSGVTCTAISPGFTRTEFHMIAGQTLTPIQKTMMMESSRVARIGIEAMLKGRASVVAGGMNALIAWTMRFLPRQWQAALADFAMH